MKRRYLMFASAAFLAAAPAARAGEAPETTQPLGASIDLGKKGPDVAKQPWLDPDRDPDERAALVLAQLTLEEKIGLVHGAGFLNVPLTSNGGAGYVPGIARLGIPDLNLADSTVGVTRGAATSRYSTLMPATIAEASSWDPVIAYDYAALVGRELRDQGYNVSLAGGANLAREPRNGRTFEYRGEDPLLAGKLAAAAIRGMQDQKVIGDLKHFALNDQETGRHSANVIIDYRAARESDLLTFEIAVREGRPGMVMCAYNKVWGEFACENRKLLTDILKTEWGFAGWVLSDWGGTHSAEKAMLAGLDQEQPGSKYFGSELRGAVIAGRLPEAALDASVRRILRTMFAVGIVDHPPERRVVDIAAGLEAARRVAEAGIVLLKNDGEPLPLAASVRTVAVIGGHADVGVLTGGGSGQVDPPGGNAVKGAPTATIITPAGIFFPKTWWPSSPLKALQAAAPSTSFIFDDGSDRNRAAALAARSDMAIVFAYSPSAEHSDNASLGLPDDQDALIGAVGDANAKTVVVLETSGAVTMPWLDKVGAIVAAWFPGASGGEAIANLLTGRTNFSGKLPITFPRSEADLPHPVIPGTDAPMVRDENSIFPELNLKIKAPFDIHYSEGALVGYKWFEANRRIPLFAFGHGLSYTTFVYSDLAVGSDEVSFNITNSGSRRGSEIAQVYAALPASARLAPRQLVGWTKVALDPGETRRVTVKYEPMALSVYDAKARRWTRPKGRYSIDVGGASDRTALSGGFGR